MIKIKNGVEPRLLIIVAAAANVATEMGVTVTITSGTDGKHMEGSFHYQGKAVDIRLLGPRTAEFMAAMKKRLGANYDVIREADHIHIEEDHHASV
jgi:hypothetical protein